MASTQKGDEEGAAVRLSINLASDADAVLRSIAARHSRNVTETVRVAIAVLDYIDRETGTGATLYVRKGDAQREIKVIWG